MLLEFGDGMAKLIGPTEQGDDVADLTMGGKWGNLEYVGQHELCVAIDRVLLQQVFENLAGFGGVAAKKSGRVSGGAVHAHGGCEAAR